MDRGSRRRASANKGRSSSARRQASSEVDPIQPVEKEWRGNVDDGLWLRLVATLKPYIVVFIASACTLIIEIVAARILAPTIGVSLYTWTGIIGVVLAGISVGNFLGGRVADRFPSATTLGLILLSGGVAGLGILALAGVVSGAFEPLPYLPRIVLVTAALFLLPSLILGMVSPVVIKLSLHDLARAGDVVGKIYAVSTAGAIFGTFITGFVLIQLIGTRMIILLVALVLILMALAFGNLWRVKIPSLSLIALFVGLGIVGIFSGTLESDCVRENNYYCIRVSDDIAEGGRKVKVLHLDKLTHSSVSLEDPTFLAREYQQVLRDVGTFIAQRNPKPRFLFIGGGYTMPRYLEAVYPQSAIEVIEIDPEVTSVVFEYMGLRADTRIVTYNEDARMAVPKLTPSQYDLVVGDAFHDISIPFHLTTREFNEQVKTLLTEDGIYAINVIDKIHSGRFPRAYVNTLRQTFQHVYVLRDNAGIWEDDSRNTYVVVASAQALSQTDFENANAQAGRGQPVAQFMPEDAFQSWFNAKENILLTDDYAPVDNLTAPIYLARGSLSKSEKHLNSGVELQTRGKFTEALEEYDEAIRLDPQYAPAYNNRGIIYEHLDEYERAVHEFNEAIRLSPKGALVYNNRGSVYIKLKQYQRANQDYDEAIRFDPRLAAAYMGRAMANTHLGNDSAAENDINLAVANGAERAKLERAILNLKMQR